jgi:aspartate aminotransferase
MSNIKLSSRHDRIKPSATIQTAKLSRKLIAEGKDIINMSMGMPDFNTPDHIKNAGINAINDNFTFYPPVAGYSDLKEAISNKFRRENKLDFSSENIVVSPGAKLSVANILLSILDREDEILIPAPFWVSYTGIVNLVGAKEVIIPTSIDNDFKLLPKDLEKNINNNTKAIIFSSPCNPTGTIYNKKDLERLVLVLKKYPDIIIISDEIYEHIIFDEDHISIGTFNELKDRVVVVNGVSKGYAMTGWRIGYIGAPLTIARACEKIQGQLTSGACAIAQKAAIEALNGSMESTNEMRIAFKRRKNLMISYLKKIPGLKTNNPKGAFYIFPDISHFLGLSYKDYLIRSSEELCEYLLLEAEVGVVSGTSFGSPDNIRLAYAISDENIHIAMQRLTKALNQLN